MIIPENIRAEGILAFFTDRHIRTDIKSLSALTGIPEASIFLPEQRHTDRVVVIGDRLRTAEADAVLSDRRGILIGVRTADCLPLILYDRKRQVVGAVHAGWRGTARGILKKTLMEMVNRFSSVPIDIFIASGPSIRWCCYEVGVEVAEAVMAVTGEGDYIETRDGKIYLDIPSANRYQALSFGVPQENIWLSEDCTCCLPDKYFSYRRNRTEERQAGLIGLMSVDW
jgi:YfiH family protein